jgi:hypothetical protein
MNFEIGEVAILNEKAIKGLPNNIGESVTVMRYRKSPNYDYDVHLSNGDIAFVRESELNRLTDEDKKIMSWLFTGNKVTHVPTGDHVKVLKVDYMNKQAEIYLENQPSFVEDFRNLREIAVDEYTLPVLEFENEKSEDVLIEKPTLQHEQLINVFFKHYENEDGTYTVPKELLNNLLEHIFE